MNPVSSDFSAGAEGLRIAGGELAEPLREFTIASTLQRMMAEAGEVGADVEWLPMRAAGVSLVVGDVTVSEGPTGQEAVFTVNLSPAPGTGEQVDVNYQTVNGSATAGSDYTARSGVLTFLAGETGHTVSVPILNDSLVEGDETFTLELSSASTNSATATATIQDDDVGSGPACGEPVWDSAVDRAVFIWNDCGTNNWKLRFTGGGSPVLLNFTGSVQSTQAISGFAPFSVESNDVLTNTPSSRIDFGLFVSGPYKDGFDFTLASGASACFDLTGPTDVPVYAGAGRVPVNLQVGIPGFGACAP